MRSVTILHNPRCSKSRQTLTLLQEAANQSNDLEIDILEYLKTPVSKTQLQEYIQMLGFSSARELMRKNEKDYKDNDLGNASLSEDELLDAMLTWPKLIERPIVILDKQARIGRPPESVLELI